MVFKRTRFSKRRRSSRKPSSRRRFVRRRRFTRPSRSVAPASYYPYGKSRTLRLRYTDNFLINAVIGVVGGHVFSANGLFDPDNTGGGHQPYGFDTIMTTYGFYTVIGSKITVHVANGQSLPFWLGVQLRPTSGGLGGSATNAILEQPGLSKILVGYNTGDKNTRTVKKTFSASKFFGTKDIINDTLYRGTTSANPTEDAYFHVVIIPYGPDDLADQRIWVQIDYIAVFTEPLLLGQS